jgi:hypothetical protein
MKFDFILRVLFTFWAFFESGVLFWVSYRALSLDPIWINLSCPHKPAITYLGIFLIMGLSFFLFFIALYLSCGLYCDLAQNGNSAQEDP